MLRTVKEMEKPKNLICTTHGCELKGGLLEGRGRLVGGAQRGNKWDNFNSIIDKIYLKNLGLIQFVSTQVNSSQKKTSLQVGEEGEGLQIWLWCWPLNHRMISCNSIASSIPIIATLPTPQDPMGAEGENALEPRVETDHTGGAWEIILRFPVLSIPIRLSTQIFWKATQCADIVNSTPRTPYSQHFVHMLSSRNKKTKIIHLVCRRSC